MAKSLDQYKNEQLGILGTPKRDLFELQLKNEIMEELFIKASRNKSRFKTNQGYITSEDLWTLPLSKLDDMVVALEDERENTGRKSRLATKSVASTELDLRIGIIDYIISTRQKENEDAKNANVKAQQAANLRELIAEKKGEALKGQSIEELEKQLAELNK